MEELKKELRRLEKEIVRLKAENVRLQRRSKIQKKREERLQGEIENLGEEVDTLEALNKYKTRKSNMRDACPSCGDVLEIMNAGANLITMCKNPKCKYKKVDKK
jgi:DNA repair exonuclease SbcCD ATPase subunit